MNHCIAMSLEESFEEEDAFIFEDSDIQARDYRARAPDNALNRLLLS